MAGLAAPLAGVLIADFSRVLAGPLATMTLADLGATVVKVERPGSGDDTRQWGPPWTAGSSAYFDCVNRSKYGVVLDLAHDADRALAAELARRADVVVENFRPGALDRFGLDHATVAAGNPRAVYCSISGFGSGAGAGRPGYDFIVQAAGGLMSVTGPADGEPMKVGLPIVDVLTGKDAVIAILAALADRRRTGRGQHVRVELLSSLLGGLVNQAASFLVTGTAPGRMGNQHPSIAPYETLRCADGVVAVACGNDGQFAKLAGALARPELAGDPRFATNPARLAHRAELIGELERGLATAPAAHWERALTAVGVPAGPVGDIGAGVALAEACGLEPLLELGPDRAPQVRHPARYDSPLAAAVPPPALDQHGDLVRAWLAGPPDRPLPHQSLPTRAGT
ncbi:CoA transferase [Jatrophihabitans cynanchi]|uniref:CoA transferase n=1 Tax=Jatrophihabitans cynanchi TaxID=2944128 RepID=A0ABY7JRG4_9ACTN|nr:CoA transferase [Jatrophihabitans sp. SB3-54]WAX55149.1 CoA transferase [Jatrophihabitans sp. SB3-54]